MTVFHGKVKAEMSLTVSKPFTIEAESKRLAKRAIMDQLKKAGLFSGVVIPPSELGITPDDTDVTYTMGDVTIEWSDDDNVQTD